MASFAVLPSLIEMRVRRTDLQLISNLFTIAMGVLIIAMLAQISIPLPFTPMPVTGQTLGVAVIALLFGRFRAVATVSSYVALATVGLPFFAESTTGAGFGPTAGYLVGMLASSFVMGHMADRGWTKSFRGAWFAAFIGIVITFSFGLAALSYYIPKSALFAWGLYPFIPGDILKSLIAAMVVSQISKRGAL